MTCEVLKLCFEKFQAGELIATYPSYIMYMLRHDSDCVRRLAVDEVCHSYDIGFCLGPVPTIVDNVYPSHKLQIDCNLTAGYKIGD